MERMNYINRPKECYTQEEWIEYLEESIRELRKEKENLKKEKGELKARLEEENDKLKEHITWYEKEGGRLREENKKLKEFKTKREESRFYFKAQMERAEPRTAKEAEQLQKAKEIFEKLYREELSCLEEENKKLKEELKHREDFRKNCSDGTW